MATIDAALDLIRHAHEELGTAEFARMAGVPYTTLRDCEARNFLSPPVATLRKLEAAAAAHALAKPSKKRRAPHTGAAA